MTTETYRGYLIREFPEGYTVVAPDGHLVRGFDKPALTLADAREAADGDLYDLTTGAALDAMRY